MPLETATFINQLVETNPTGTDNANQGDNHLRLIKAAVKNTFPNVTGAVTATHTQLNTAYLPLAGGALTGAVTSSSTITASGFSGPLTGNVTGNVTGNATGNAGTATALQTARTINGVAFNGTANISYTTDAVAEGATNRYYTDARARAAVSATGTGLTYNNTTGVFTFTPPNTDAVAEGATNRYYTDARARLAVSATGTGLAYNNTTGVFTFSGVSSVAGRTGAITLDIADVTNLQASLNGKLNTSGGSLSGNLSVTGSITATGDITAFSDERLKSSIVTLAGALDKVKAMRGVSFVGKLDWKPRIGVIAQEVEAVIPEVVNTNEQGLKSVAYGNLVGVLIEAVKELEARLAELERR